MLAIGDATRCSGCKKEDKKDKELQFAALNVLSTAVNGAFAVAANPDDRNSKLQFGNALANSFIGLIAAAMKCAAVEMYDAEGNLLTPDQIVHIIRAQLRDEQLN